MDLLKLFYHSVFLTFSCATLCYDYLYNEIGSAGPWGRLKYFTIWNVIFQVAYFAFSVFLNFTEGRSNPPYKHQQNPLQRFRDLLHASVLFPSAMFVSVYFWTLFYIDRELVWPLSFDDVLPNWFNHFLHTNVFLFAVLDKLVVRHHYPSFLTGLFGTCLVTGLYFACLYYLHQIHNVWVYPVLELFNTKERLMFLGSCSLSSILFYFIGQWLQGYLWPVAPKLTNEEKVKGN